MKKLMLLGTGLLLMVGIVFGVKMFATHMVEGKLHQAAARIKDKADIAYKDVDVEVFGLNLVVHDVDVKLPTGQKMTIGEVVVHDMDVKNKPPHHARVELKNLHVDVNKENFGREYQAIRDMGYDTLEGDVLLDYSWAPETGNVLLRECDVDIPGLAKIQLALGLSHVDLVKVKKLELEDLVIEEMHFNYVDQSFLRKMVQVTAVDEKEIIDFLVAGLQEDIERARERQQTEAVETMTEVISFIEAPVGLTVDVTLGDRTAMEQIMISKKISEIVKLFNIKVEATG